MTEAQAATLEFLLRALPGPVTRIDTHAAVVLLSGDRAYKMKRAVQFTFLNFSTLDRREHALRTELELNRRTAPDLYLRVLPITRTNGGALAIDGQGSPVEWLLEMRRFSADAPLDRLAERGLLTLPTMDELAAVIAAFHEVAAPRPDRGGFNGMREIIEENAENLRELTGPIFEASDVEEVTQSANAALDRSRMLLDARRAAGLVRHCHGDLHLANIVMIDDHPVLFDCLEFNEDYACIDVLYDLAFVVMDLLERDLAEHAHRLLQGWLDRTTDDGGLALLPLFLATRAIVRAKVEAFRARECQEQAGHRRAAEQAAAYFALAKRSLVPAPPRLVAVGGRSGTGKSAVAMAVAPRLGALPGAIVLRSDIIRKRMLGETPTTRLPASAYAPDISARVYALMAERARLLLSAGHSVIADAVFALPQERAQIEEAARGLAVPFSGVWLTAPEAILEARVAARREDPSDADGKVIQRQRSIGFPRSDAWRHVSSDQPFERVLGALSGTLGAPAATPSGDASGV